MFFEITSGLVRGFWERRIPHKSCPCKFIVWKDNLSALDKAMLPIQLLTVCGSCNNDWLMTSRGLSQSPSQKLTPYAFALESRIDGKNLMTVSKLKRELLPHIPQARSNRESLQTLDSSQEKSKIVQASIYRTTCECQNTICTYPPFSKQIAQMLSCQPTVIQASIVALPLPRIEFGRSDRSKMASVEDQTAKPIISSLPVHD